MMGGMLGGGVMRTGAIIPFIASGNTSPQSSSKNKAGEGLLGFWHQDGRGGR